MITGRSPVKPLLTAELRAALDASPMAARTAHERELTRLSRACACGEGAVGALTLGALVMWRFLHSSSDASLLGVASLIAQLLLAFLIGGFTGKFLGLAIARARLRALCLRIAREGAHPQP